MQSHIRRFLFTSHSWAAILFSSLLLLICLSGCWAVLNDELTHWANPNRVAAQTVQAANLDRLPALAQAHGLDPNHFIITLPSSGQPTLRLSAAGRGQPTPTVILQPHTLTPVATPSHTAINLVTDLHKHLFLGFPGRVLVSLFGLALSILLIGGFAMHLHRWRQTLPLRRHKPAATLSADVHKLVGFGLFPLLLVIALSGLFSGLGALGTMTLSGQAFQGGMPAAMAALMPQAPLLPPPTPETKPLPLSQLWQQHQQAWPHRSVHSLTLSDWHGPNARLSVATSQAWSFSTPLFEQDHYRRDGQLMRHDSAAQQGLWTQAFVAIQPLHYAQYGGDFSKGLHLFGGLATVVLTLTGTVMWLARQHRRGRPTHGLQWLTLSLGGGLFMAMCLLLLSAAPAPYLHLSGRAHSALFWGCWLSICLLAAWPTMRRLCLWLLPLFGGLMLIAASLAHALMAYVYSLVPTLWLDALLLLAGSLACACAALIFSKRPHPRS